MKTGFLIIGLLAGLCGTAHAADTPQTAASAVAVKPSAVPAGKRVVAYYISWGAYGRNYYPSDIDASKITHLNYAFANIANGRVTVGDPNVDTRGKNNFGALRRLKRQNPALQTLISVGGWSWSRSFSDVALTEQSRKVFADSTVEFMREHSFDGVDIDWEFPVSGGLETNVYRPEDKQNFTLLFAALRNALDEAGKKDGRSYLLTAALGNSEKFLGNTEMGKAMQYMDFANVMAYDLNGTWSKTSGHLAPLYHDPASMLPGASDKNNVASLVDLMLKAGVPADKLVLGVPFYGVSWKKCAAEKQGEYQPCDGKGRGSWEDGTLDYTEIEDKLVNKKGFTRYWNNTAKAPFLYNPDSGEFVSYEDSESLGYKLKLIKEKNLGGAMFWEITGDRKQTLLKQLAKDLLPAAQ